MKRVVKFALVAALVLSTYINGAHALTATVCNAGSECGIDCITTEVANGACIALGDTASVRITCDEPLSSVSTWSGITSLGTECADSSGDGGTPNGTASQCFTFPLALGDLVVDCSESPSSSSTGLESSSSSSTGVVGPSTGGNEQSSSSSGASNETDSSSSGSGTPGEDCQPGTYSENGFAPCFQCANNTYANIRETSCTSCPEHTHAPVGAASLTECVCDDGYTSLWASGGPCYPEEDAPSFEYCERGTFSETGYKPCEACGNNSYANVFETECHSCPANMHTVGDAPASLTDCVCDEGYWSPWATGGPCYGNNDTAPPPPDQGEGNVTDPDCNDYTSADECNRDDKCHALMGHSCDKDRWTFISCINKTVAETCAAEAHNGESNSTCAENGDGERAWFANKCIPDDWETAAVDSQCGSCCKPHQYTNDTNGHGNVGGCSFVNNSACVLLEYQGECPSTDAINVWRIKVIEAVADAVSKAKNVSKADATVSVTIYAMPRTNTGTESCAVRLQIFPPATGDLTANDFMEAIWEQFNAGGNDMAAEGASLSGIAGYKTFGSLTPVGEDIIIDDDDDDDDDDWWNSATSSSVSMTTIGVVTIGAMIAAKITQ